MSFAERMLAKRKEKEFSQQKMADLVGTSNIMISRYETGKMVPSVEIGAKIAHALNTTLDYLVMGYTPDQSSEGSKNITLEVESLQEDDLKHIIAVVEAFKTKAKVQNLLKG